MAYKRKPTKQPRPSAIVNLTDAQVDRAIAEYVLSKRFPHLQNRRGVSVYVQWVAYGKAGALHRVEVYVPKRRRPPAVA